MCEKYKKFQINLKHFWKTKKKTFRNLSNRYSKKSWATKKILFLKIPLKLLKILPKIIKILSKLFQNLIYPLKVPSLKFQIYLLSSLPTLIMYVAENFLFRVFNLLYDADKSSNNSLKFKVWRLHWSAWSSMFLYLIREPCLYRLFSSHQKKNSFIESSSFWNRKTNEEKKNISHSW